MKKFAFLAAALAACAALVTLSAPRAFAQDLTLQPGFGQTTLLTLSDAIGGFDLDASGSLYYIGGSADTQVVRASGAGYSSLTPIVDYGGSTYGSFLVVKGTMAYYGDYVSGSAGYGNINASSTAVITPTPGPTVISNLPSNYDMAFSGSNAFVSANISGTDNEVFSLNLATGVYKPIIDTNGDYSGPIAVTPSGSLIYGGAGPAYSGTTYLGGVGGLYIFSAAQVSAALGSGSTLTLGEAGKIISDAGNSGLAAASDTLLYQTFSPLSGTAAISEYNLATGASTLVGSLSTPGDYFAGLRSSNGALQVAVTDGYSSSRIIQVVPEPATAVSLILGAGLALAGTLRRRRNRAQVLPR